VSTTVQQVISFSNSADTASSPIAQETSQPIYGTSPAPVAVNEIVSSPAPAQPPSATSTPTRPVGAASPQLDKVFWGCVEAIEVTVITVGVRTSLIALGAGGLAGSGPLAATGVGAVIAIPAAVLSVEAMFTGAVSVAGGVYVFGSTCALPVYGALAR